VSDAAATPVGTAPPSGEGRADHVAALFMVGFDAYNLRKIGRAQMRTRIFSVVAASIFVGLASAPASAADEPVSGGGGPAPAVTAQRAGGPPLGPPR
jgi:hypothetical protein